MINSFIMLMAEPPTPPPASLIYEPPGIIARLDLAAMFPRVQPLEVELGSGDGSFLAEYAARHPGHQPDRRGTPARPPAQN